MNYIYSIGKASKVFYDKINHSLFYNDDANRFIKINRIFDPIDKYTKFKYFFSDPTLIIDDIYLGSAYNASDKDFLDNNDIGLIINVTPDISNYYIDEDIQYLSIKIYDNNLDDIKPYLNIAFDKIKSFKSSQPDKKILIHCFMGASRSVSILIYYLMKKYNYTLDDAISFIKQKREIINLSTLFYNDLSKISFN
jgi:hypothetical protein